MKWWRSPYFAAVVFAALLNVGNAASAQESIAIDTQAADKPFPHFWEQMFGSGRAILVAA